jgi:hypothetical protein
MVKWPKRQRRRRGSVRRKLLVAAISVLSLCATAFGVEVAQLERWAAHEVVPELQLAAGVALGLRYADVKTVEAMEALAVDGRTPGLRRAAQVALEVLYVRAGKSEADLIALTETGATPELRAAVVPALMTLLARKPTAEVRGLAVEGATSELRLAAAQAYYFRRKGAFVLDLDGLQAQAGQNDSKELEIAAGELLGGFYLFHPRLRKTQGELAQLADGAPSDGLRVAAGVALAASLIQSDVTAAGLVRILVASTGVKSQAYLEAHIQALAVRWAAPG